MRYPMRCGSTGWQGKLGADQVVSKLDAELDERQILMFRKLAHLRAQKSRKEREGSQRSTAAEGQAGGLGNRYISTVTGAAGNMYRWLGGWTGSGQRPKSSAPSFAASGTSTAVS